MRAARNLEGVPSAVKESQPGWMRQRSQHSPGGFHRKGLHIALGWDGGQQPREAEFGRVSRHWTSKRTEKDLFLGSGDRGRCLGPAWAPGGVGC